MKRSSVGGLGASSRGRKGGEREWELLGGDKDKGERISSEGQMNELALSGLALGDKNKASGLLVRKLTPLWFPTTSFQRIDNIVTQQQG